MNRTLTRLAERRALLVERAAAERIALARWVAPWRAPLALADRGGGMLRSLGRAPAWLLGAVLLLVLMRSGRAGKWTRFLWTAWRAGRRMFRT